MTNTSGQGAAAAVPPEIDRWNWGAFLLNWIWGIGNNTLIALLMFVPLVNFVMFFVLGAKGSAWAWRNKRWDSVEQFQAVQRSWAKWGAIVWAGFIVFFVGLFFAISAGIKSSDAFKLAVAKLESHETSIRLIGKPVSTGFPTGQMQLVGTGGSANLSFSVEGPQGKGTVYVAASKEFDRWSLSRMVLVPEGSEQPVDLVP